jgi:hypothetical protein
LNFVETKKGGVELVSPTHKRTEGRSPVWGSEFNIKAAALQGIHNILLLGYEHSEKARTPHKNGPRDVPRCGALSLLQKPLHYKGG